MPFTVYTLFMDTNTPSIETKLKFDELPTKQLSSIELAELNGHILALSEQPQTMPQFKETWAFNVAKREIHREAAFNGKADAELEALTLSFYKSYSKHFHEYYDTMVARNFGFNYGLKFNPALSGLFPKSPSKILAVNRMKLEEEFDIPNEATWRLFCRAFEIGFAQGYAITKKGVTIESYHETILLFDE